MPVITRTFDPERLVTLASLAREIGVTDGAAQRWWHRNAGKPGVPDPLFVLKLGTRSLYVWRDSDIEPLVNAYRAGRAARGLE